MRVRLILILIFLVTSSVSCSAAGSGEADGTLSVVASFYPLAEAAQRVGGERVSVTNLTTPGVEPHDLELTPDQVGSIATADLVLYIGGGFQPAVEEAASQSEGTAVDVLDGVETLAPPAGEADAGVSVDPHIWLDPARFAQVVEAIGASLASIDPSHADGFTAAASSEAQDLAALDREFREGLADCARTTIVTSHEAFGYLAAAYGLTQVGISGVDPEAEPDARRIAELRDLVESEGITTIFTEDLVSPEVAETLAREAGVGTAVLHTVEGLSEEQVAAGADYASEMRENLGVMREALDCA